MGERGPVSAGAGQVTDYRLGGVVGAGVLCALLFCLVAFVPPLGPIALVSPVPLLVLRLRGGSAAAALGSVLAVALVAAAVSAGAAVGFVLMLLVPGLLVAESVARGRGMLRGCVWGFSLLVAQTGLALLVSAPAMSEQSLAPLEHLRSEAFVSELRASGVPEETLSDFVRQVGVVRDALAVVYPAAWMILAGLVVIANAGLLRLYLLRRDPGWLEDGEFERLRFPPAVIPIFILGGAAVALPVARPVAYNVLLVVAFFFALQGLAVVGFYARRLAGPPLLRFAVLLLVLANPWAPQILALLGLFDNWFDFRRWADPPREKA